MHKTLKTRREVSFAVSRRERDLISKIADRAVAAKLYKFSDVMSAQMDITACHANGNPLRLEALLAADDFNFFHDVVGIYRHLDRDTGELRNFFCPRFSQPEA